MPYRTIPKQTYCSKRDGTMKKDLKKCLQFPAMCGIIGYTQKIRGAKIGN